MELQFAVLCARADQTPIMAPLGALDAWCPAGAAASLVFLSLYGRSECDMCAIAQWAAAHGPR